MQICVSIMCSISTSENSFMHDDRPYALDMRSVRFTIFNVESMQFPPA